MAVHEQAKGPIAVAEVSVVEPPRASRRVSTEVLLETVLILLAGALFGYTLLEANRVHPDVGRLPKIAGGFGLSVLVVYLVLRVRNWGRVDADRQIMDTGFDEEGLERRHIITRTLRVALSTVALFVSIRLFGFHISVPLYIFGYLIFWGRVRWYWALVAAGGFEAYMVLAYDLAVRSHWSEPLVPGFPG